MSDRQLIKLFVFPLQSPSNSQEDVNSPSDNKEEDEGSEDESDERMDQATYDPERLKAFNVIKNLNFRTSMKLIFSPSSPDVCTFICRREPRPNDSHFEATEGESASDN